MSARWHFTDVEVASNPHFNLGIDIELVAPKKNLSRI
jgi:hypothetical protein